MLGFGPRVPKKTGPSWWSQSPCQPRILGRVHRLVEFEMQESRDRQEDEEEQDQDLHLQGKAPGGGAQRSFIRQEGESPKPPKTITSNILAHASEPVGAA